MYVQVTPIRGASRCRASRFATFSIIALLAGSLPSVAVGGDELVIGLEELLNTDVTGASRRTQSLRDVAAAVFVLSRDDIRRSGATTIPEALRLVPGVQVARIANNRWAVTVRGFNGRYANKLQVLLDGRSLYSPLFAGVFWEAEDTLIDDIERIEVIRGPGAAMWGANAVNGVINIVTRKARDTLGTLLVGGGGTEGGEAAVRHGFSSGDGHLRFWARGFSSDTSIDAAGAAGNDHWRGARAGFRGDWPLARDSRLTVSGGAHRGELGDRWLEPDLVAADGVVSVDHVQTNHGAHLLARHEAVLGDGSETAFQVWVEHNGVRLNQIIDEQRDTVDLDFQHRLYLGTSNLLMYGAEYRYSRDQVSSAGILAFDPPRSSYRLASVFVHDELTLVPDTFSVAAGVRLEHNSLTGVEPQPSIRALWTPNRHQTVWASAARAARVPSRAERDSTVEVRVNPAAPPTQPLPVLIRSMPAGESLDSEKLVAAEAGYRQLISERASIDIAVFANRYRGLRSSSLGSASVAVAPVLHVVQETALGNGVSARTRGVELAGDVQLTNWWRLYPTLTYLDVETWATNPADFAAIESAAALVRSSPERQATLRSSMTVGWNHQVDLVLRYAGALGSNAATGSPGVPSYTAVDLRYGWRPVRGVEVSLVGRNLFDRQHPEFVSSELPSEVLEVERSFFAKVAWEL